MTPGSIRMISKEFMPVSKEVRLQWIAYAAGYAAALLKRHNQEAPGPLTKRELAWLNECADLGTVPEQCQRLIDAYTVQQVTKRLKT